MKKIPTLFERDKTQKGHPVTPVVNPECAWVMAGEGIPTRKLDGTCVKVQGCALFKRAKPADGDYTDASYVPAVSGPGSDKWIFEAFDAHVAAGGGDGVYEAIGPKIQGNPEKSETHRLVALDPVDAELVLPDVAREFEAIKEFLKTAEIEGIVFHHADGRRAKIKKRDFGFGR